MFILLLLKMNGIEVHWNILREEGRVLKAAVDLVKLKCIFVSKDYNLQHIRS
jgi:hypothetical protein